jgi:hypothetical protein
MAGSTSQSTSSSHADGPLTSFHDPQDSSLHLPDGGWICQMQAVPATAPSCTQELEGCRCPTSCNHGACPRRVHDMSWDQPHLPVVDSCAGSLSTPHALQRHTCRPLAAGPEPGSADASIRTFLIHTAHGLCCCMPATQRHILHPPSSTTLTGRTTEVQQCSWQLPAPPLLLAPAPALHRHPTLGSLLATGRQIKRRLKRPKPCRTRVWPAFVGQGRA